MLLCRYLLKNKLFRKNYTKIQIQLTTTIDVTMDGDSMSLVRHENTRKFS